MERPRDASLAPSGRLLAQFVKADVMSLVAAGGRWIGEFEWRVTESGAVTLASSTGVRAVRDAVAAIQRQGRELPDMAHAFMAFMAQAQPVDAEDEAEDDAEDEDEDEDDERTLFFVYVRLEPGVYVESRGAVVHRVFNMNNVEMYPSLCGRGFFSAMLGELAQEEWRAGEQPLQLQCEALLVQNICNRALVRHIDACGRGWVDPKEQSLGMGMVDRMYFCPLTRSAV